MRFRLICVGKLSKPYQPVFAHYEKLLSPYVKLELHELSEVPVSQGEARVKAREGEGILSRLKANAHTVALDRLGEEFSSEELSALLAERKLRGISDFQFILGGAVGLDDPVLQAADVRWSLSRLTFPHQLARCVVAEQLYRAIRIERGEPYHY